jgi:hypothetical protein
MMVCMPIGIALISSSKPAARAASHAWLSVLLVPVTMFSKMEPALMRPF